MPTYTCIEDIARHVRKPHRRRSSCEGEVGHTREGTWGNKGAGILIVTEDLSELLLLKRSPGVNDPHLWGIPGGACKEYDGVAEDALITAVSESSEELGSLPHGRLRDDPYLYQCPGKDFTFTTYVLETSRGTPDTYIPCLNWEHTRFRWYTFEEALDEPLLHAGVRDVIRHYPF